MDYGIDKIIDGLYDLKSNLDNLNSRLEFLEAKNYENTKLKKELTEILVRSMENEQI